MISFESIESIDIKENTAVTVGKFDGLHPGHRLLLNAVLSEKDGLKTAVVMLYTGNEAEKRLLSLKETNETLENLGIDYFIRIPLNDGLKRMSPEEFLKGILIDKLHARFIACGDDFRFGKRREGTPEFLSGKEEAYGFRLAVFKRLSVDNTVISSTAIRETLLSGNMEKTGRLLGEYYSISGKVLHGRALGRTLGFPTLNIAPASDKLLPPYGVYFGEARIGGACYSACINLGVKPTVTEDNTVLLEANLLDASGDFYGMEAKVSLIRFVRPERKFESTESLRAQVEADREICRKIAAS